MSAPIDVDVALGGDRLLLGQGLLGLGHLGAEFSVALLQPGGVRVSAKPVVLARWRIAARGVRLDVTSKELLLGFIEELLGIARRRRFDRGGRRLLLRSGRGRRARKRQEASQE